MNKIVDVNSSHILLQIVNVLGKVNCIEGDSLNFLTKLSDLISAEFKVLIKSNNRNILNSMIYSITIYLLIQNPIIITMSIILKIIIAIFKPMSMI